MNESDLLLWGTNVGEESTKSFSRKLLSGFFPKYMSGDGLDIGYAGYKSNRLPILPTAVGVDTDFPGYDGKILPFKDNSVDYVYSSHCLEHIKDWDLAINEWYRVTKENGYIVIVVPHHYLYEKKKQYPSRWNGDHNRFYTPASLLTEVERALQPNSYRVRFLEDGDQGFDYSLGPDKHSGGEYEITLVIQKIRKPDWDLE